MAAQGSRPSRKASPERRASRSRRAASPQPEDPFELPPTREASPFLSSTNPSPGPPPVISQSRRAGAAEKRRAVPLEMPQATPLSAEPASGKAQGKKRAKQCAAPRPEPAPDLTPEEYAVGVTREQQDALFKLADMKQKAGEAWREVGEALMSTTRRQFAALKTNPWRSNLFAKSSVKVGPVNIKFAKELFDVSVDSMLPRMARRQEEASDEAKKGAGAMTVSFTPKRRAEPEALELDEDRPGFSSFLAAKLKSGVVPSDAGSEAHAGSEARSETRSDAAGEAAAPAAARAEPEEAGVDELRAEWDELADAEKEGFKAADEKRAAEWEREKEAWAEEQAGPKTAYGVRLRDPLLARKLLRLPEHWKAYEIVSVSGHHVQQARVTRVDMSYDVATQQLTLNCTVGYSNDEAGSSQS